MRLAGLAQASTCQASRKSDGGAVDAELTLQSSPHRSVGRDRVAVVECRPGRRDHGLQQVASAVAFSNVHETVRRDFDQVARRLAQAQGRLEQSGKVACDVRRPLAVRSEREFLQA